MQQLAQLISSALFLWYGLGCFLSKRMVTEFQHYRLARFRVLTGVLQVAGSLGLIAGHFYHPLLLLAAGGLSIMMLLAFVTRIKIRDPFYTAIPSFALFVMNGFIVVAAV